MSDRRSDKQRVGSAYVPTSYSSDAIRDVFHQQLHDCPLNVVDMDVCVGRPSRILASILVSVVVVLKTGSNRCPCAEATYCFSS